MDRHANQIRKKLAEGHRVFGAAVFSWSPYVIDVAASAGLDYIRIDTEHAWPRDGKLEQLIRAAIMGGIVPIVRVDRDNLVLVRKVLEIGAGGVIVPDVRSIEQAKSIVEEAKFPPHGKRGYSSNCWSADWGASGGAEWVEWSNREPMIGIMIENVDAMQSIDEILAVDGVDFALFGPSDYAMSLGLGAPKANDDGVQQAINATIRAAHKAGKHIALGVGTDPSTIEKYVGRGIDMLELGNDLGIVRENWKKAKAAAESISSAS
ncbi:MAG: hypothetical protein HQ492_07695 [Woeseiaceae bacterium]|nr:hypothetical protein [Woeseiaceae bacterium]